MKAPSRIDHEETKGTKKEKKNLRVLRFFVVDLYWVLELSKSASNKAAMRGERRRDVAHDAVVYFLHPRVPIGALRIRFGARRFGDGDVSVTKILDAFRPSGAFAIGPQRLNSRADRRPFFIRHADDLGVEDVGQYLSPDGALRPAAGGANLARRDAEFAQAVQPVIQSERRAFHRRSREMSDRKSLVAQPEVDASSVGDVRRAFAFEEGNQHQPVVARRDRRRRLRHLVV